MSAPKESPETQAERHKPALSGIALSLIVGGVLLLLIVGYAFLAGGDEDAPVPDAVEGTPEG